MGAKKAPRKRKERDITEDVSGNIKKNFDCSNIVLRNTYPMTDNQQKFYYKTQKPDTNMVFVDGPAGSSKAQPLTEPIPTPNGWKTMGDLKVDDYVFDSGGNPTKILGVFPQGEKEIYNVTLSDGSSTRCCGEHLWTTSTYLDRNRWSSKRINGKKKKIEKLPPIFKTLTTEEIKNTLYKGGRINHMIPIVENPVVYNVMDPLPIDPYAFGVLLGDGCFRTRPVRVSSSDEEIVDYFKNKFGSDFKHIKKYDYRILNIDKKIEDLGMFGHYSYEKFIPDIYKISSVDDRIELLQGLLDSDGCATKKGAVTFSTTSIKLANDLMEIVNSLGGIAHCSERLSFLNGAEHRIYYQIYVNLPKNITPFKLTRKLVRYTPNTKYSPKRYIKNIEKIGVEECQCILVDNPTHLYLTKNYIVTHNTFLAVFTALELLRDNHIDQIIYIRSVVESSSKSMGYLKGDENEKFLPYMMPMMDKLNELLLKSDTNHLIINEYVKAIPVNFVRGLTFHRCVVVIDEAQNMTRSELTTILTRFGRNSKYFILGDSNQTDIKGSGFKEVYELFDTPHSEKNDIYCVKFDVDDIVRSNILKHITQVLKV